MINELIRILSISKNIVFFTGAGISTESNIPDFRSAEGLYRSISTFGFPPEQILSHSFFYANTAVFFKYYFENMIHLDAKPNAAHHCIYELEKLGYNVSVITQNVDGLHQMARSCQVVELHGSVYRNYCIECHKKYHLQEIIHSNGIPYCHDCRGIIRPDITLYEEELNAAAIDQAISLIRKADVLIVMGTSLLVYPANSLLRYLRNSNLVIINKEKTAFDNQAKYVIHDSCGKILSEMIYLLKGENEYTQ